MEVRVLTVIHGHRQNAVDPYDSVPKLNTLK